MSSSYCYYHHKTLVTEAITPPKRKRQRRITYNAEQAAEACIAEMPKRKDTDIESAQFWAEVIKERYQTQRVEGVSNRRYARKERESKAQIVPM